MTNPIADYKARRGISVTELAKQLGTSKGHVSDLVSGKAGLGIKTAKALARLTGKAWHKYLPEDAL